MCDAIEAPSSELALSDTVRLNDPEVYIGKLVDVIEPDGMDIVLAVFGKDLLEIPKFLAGQLWKFIGQRVTIGLVSGKWRIGRASQ